MNSKILYMVTREQLEEEIERLSNNSMLVTVVAPLREFREPNMDGVVITDWLIVYIPLTKIRSILK